MCTLYTEVPWLNSTLCSHGSCRLRRSALSLSCLKPVELIKVSYFDCFYRSVYVYGSMVTKYFLVRALLGVERMFMLVERKAPFGEMADLSKRQEHLYFETFTCNPSGHLENWACECASVYWKLQDHVRCRNFKKEIVRFQRDLTCGASMERRGRIVVVLFRRGIVGRYI